MPVFLSFFPKNRHFEMGSNCDVLTLKRTSFSTFFVVGRSNHLPTTSAFFRQIPSVSIYTKNSKSIWQQCHVGSNPTVCAKGSTAGRCFLFLRQTMQGLQGEIRTARVRRFASRRAATACGLLQGRGRIPPPAPIITTQVLHWVVIFIAAL